MKINGLVLDLSPYTFQSVFLCETAPMPSGPLSHLPVALTQLQAHRFSFILMDRSSKRSDALSQGDEFMTTGIPDHGNGRILCPNGERSVQTAFSDAEKPQLETPAHWLLLLQGEFSLVMSLAQEPSNPDDGGVP